MLYAFQDFLDPGRLLGLPEEEPEHDPLEGLLDRPDEQPAQHAHFLLCFNGRRRIGVPELPGGVEQHEAPD